MNDTYGRKIAKKLLNAALLVILRRSGHTAYGIFELRDRIVKDLLYNNQETLREKIWAYRRGFLSHTSKDYGLTNDNYKSFVPDFDYYKLYPVNKKFSHLIDDKITLKFVLAPFKEYLPKYYFHMKKPGEIRCLMDMDPSCEPNVKAVMELLKKEANLAVKLVAGEKGAGFNKISYIDGRYFINGSEVEEDKMAGFLSTLSNYLITEYITAHHDISRIYSQAPNTLRVMMINEDGRNPFVANALMRFGRNDTGPIEKITANGGGIFAIVDIRDGRYHDGKRIEDYHAVNCEYHPDTNVKIEGVLPHWELIKEKLVEICKYLPGLTYMGFDVVMTEQCFKILEINSMQGVNFYQYYYPLLIDNEASSFFNKLIGR